MFEKTKEFVKKHHTEIEVAAAIVATTVGCLAGVYCAHKIEVKRIKSNEAMNIIFNVLGDIPDGAPIRVYGGIIRAGLNPKELGKLGEQMIVEGADALNDAFTHFIAIKKMDA